MNRTRCVLCGADAATRYELPRARMQSELARFLGAEPPPGAIDLDYALMRCPSCELEFASPMQPGNGNFYGWITRLPQYYVSHRWEWDVVTERILRNSAGAGTRTLEVGCGSGNFMQRFHARTALPIVGIDTTPTSIAEVRSRGLEAHVATLADVPQLPLPQRRFDCIVAFHCLEHVDDPLDFLKRCLALLGDRGRLFISVPMSPMAAEARLFDPLNHPPHHLTRWTDVSFRKAAELLQLDVRIDSEKPPPAPLRALRMLRITHAGLNSHGLWMSALTALRHPWSLAAATLEQLQRRRLDHHVAGDTLLVEFSKRGPQPAASTEKP